MVTAPHSSSQLRFSRTLSLTLLQSKSQKQMMASILAELDLLYRRVKQENQVQGTQQTPIKKHSFCRNLGEALTFILMEGYGS